jgi:hypothetical protein
MRMKPLLLFLVLAGLVGCSGSSKSPSADAVRAEVAESLPPYVKIDNLTVEGAGENLFNFKATITPLETLFVADRGEVPLNFIKAVQTETDHLSVYGRFIAARQVDKWQFGQLEITSGLEVLGKPRGSFAEAYITGSPEATKAIAQYQERVERQRIIDEKKAESDRKEAAELAAVQEKQAAEQQAKDEADRKDYRDKLLAMTAIGRRYVGIVTSNGGQSQGIAVRFVAQVGFIITAEFSNPDQPKARRKFKGQLVVDPSQAPIQLSPVGAPAIDPSQAYGSGIWALYLSDGSVSLNLDGEGLNGRANIGNGYTLRLETAPDVDSSADAKAQSAPVDASAYPSVPGGYAWIDGKWVSLPHNNGHVTYAAKQVAAGVFGLLNSLGNTHPSTDSQGPDKLADLTFDGSDPIPSADPAKVIIVYVGSIPPTPNDVLAKYPDYPVMEMARSTTGSDNVRKAPLYRIVAGLGGFISTRVPAVVEQNSETITTLTCAHPIPSGTYAITAGASPFELNVR